MTTTPGRVGTHSPQHSATGVVPAFEDPHPRGQKPRCGTQPESDHQHATNWNNWHECPDPEARVRKGSYIEQGVRILGTPLGHPDYVHSYFQNVLNEHGVLLSRIPLVEDVQSAWALLLHCAGGRANYMLRVVRPESAQRFAEGQHERIVGMFAQHLGELSGSRPHKSRHVHFAFIPGEHGVEERRTEEPTSVLGKLGGLSGHAEGTPPRTWPLCVCIRCRTLGGHRHWCQHRQQQGICPEWKDSSCHIGKTLPMVYAPQKLKPDDFEAGGLPRRVAARSFHSCRTTTQGLPHGAAHR